ncbi:pyridoxamine 5'-phosphate oxidase family protein [Lacticaseibacillus jixiensis]|uniref:pyridoxamine 5'-phosphate oxidase family protein n=1 Tax=Lacticaseibacillus jixiensis TaxID=3231926 RepID=UPI0036F44138
MQPMRRQDRQIDLTEIKQIVKQCHVMHIALNDAPFPYVVPTNYGYEWAGETLILYSHGAPEGKKRQLIAADPHVCVEIDGGATLLPAGTNAPAYSAAYQSVIGYGTAELVNDPAVKRHALDLLLQHETGQALATYDPVPEAVIQHVGVIKLTLPTLTGKAHHDPAAQAQQAESSDAVSGASRSEQD